jgi:epoxide hydrolase-like predicted phosphatase
MAILRQKYFSWYYYGVIKVIIFDFFDVIHGDPYKTWLKNHGFRREGNYAEISNKLDRGEIKLDEFLELLSQASGESSDLIMDEFGLVPKIDHAVVNLVDKLHKHYRTALLSNAPSASLRKTINDNDLAKHFDEIVISSEVGLIKPNKEIFELITTRLNIDPSEALFIDDSEHHVAGAEKAGIKSIQFISLEQLIDDLADAGIKVSNELLM